MADNIMGDIHSYQKYAKRACAVCDGTTSKLLFRQTFSEMSSGSLLKGYDVVVCEECGFGFADHIPDQTDFDAHYRDMSKYEYQDQGGKETEYDLGRLRAVTESIVSFLPNINVRLLDVGCATGRLLALFKEKGFNNVLGLDPSPVCAQTAERLYGARVLTGTICEIDKVMADEQPFDFVVMAGILEHLRDIDHALLRMRKVLASSGLLFVEVPDATAFGCWSDAPFQEFSTEHVNFFSTKSLENLMRRYGFVRVFSRQVTRDRSHGMVMPVVTALYRKENEIQALTHIRDNETMSSLGDYIRKSQEAEIGIQREIEVLVKCAKPIVVWGVGTHTLHLLTTSRLLQANIRAFVDSNVRYQGKELDGIPIISPNDLLDRPESILISSRVFQKEIKDVIQRELKVRNEIITLYSDV